MTRPSLVSNYLLLESFECRGFCLLVMVFNSCYHKSLLDKNLNLRVRNKMTNLNILFLSLVVVALLLFVAFYLDVNVINLISFASNSLENLNNLFALKFR